MYNFLHKHKDYVIKYCITIKVLVYILKQLLKHLFILCQLVSRSACMSVCTMYALGAPGGRKSVCGFLQLTKLQCIFLYHLTQDPGHFQHYLQLYTRCCKQPITFLRRLSKNAMGLSVVLVSRKMVHD